MELSGLVLCICLFCWAALHLIRTDKLPKDSVKPVRLNRHDGGHLAYYHWPAKGPSLLLIPDSWSDYQQYDVIRNYLDQDTYLVMVELPEHGHSWPPSLEGSIEGFAHNVLQVADNLGWKSWYVGGHSIGGMVAIELASKRPKEVSGVISIEGWSHH